MTEVILLTTKFLVYISTELGRHHDECREVRIVAPGDQICEESKGDQESQRVTQKTQQAGVTDDTNNKSFEYILGSSGSEEREVATSSAGVVSTSTQSNA